MLNVFVTIYSLLFSSVYATQESRIIKVINKNGSGTGFLIAIKNNKSYYATNLHVCSEVYTSGYYKLSSLKIKTGSDRLIDAETKEVDNEHDICIISVDEKINSSPLKVNDRPSSSVDEVEILTQPIYGRKVAGLYKGRDMSRDLWIATHRDSHVVEGYCVSGMSGSPVLQDSSVVGIVWGCTKDSRYAVFTPIRYLSRLIDSL